MTFEGSLQTNGRISVDRFTFHIIHTFLYQNMSIGQALKQQEGYGWHGYTDPCNSHKLTYRNIRSLKELSTAAALCFDSNRAIK